MQFETDLRASCDRPIVFVIEREQVVRSALHYILRDRYRTFTFASLDEAFAASADAPAVVLAGATILHGRNDDELLIGLHERYGDAAILVVADRGSDPLAQLCLEHGARIVCKPISFDTINEAVDRALATPIPHDTPSCLIRVAFG